MPRTPFIGVQNFIAHVGDEITLGWIRRFCRVARRPPTLGCGSQPIPPSDLDVYRVPLQLFLLVDVFLRGSRSGDRPITLTQWKLLRTQLKNYRPPFVDQFTFPSVARTNGFKVLKMLPWEFVGIGDVRIATNDFFVGSRTCSQGLIDIFNFADNVSDNDGFGTLFHRLQLIELSLMSQALGDVLDLDDEIVGMPKSIAH